MNRPRIAILGANGQVGSELSLILAASGLADVRGVVRAEYGAALLRLAGIPHVAAGPDDPEGLGRAVGDCDLVVDLTYPAGAFVEASSAIEKNTRAVMNAMRRGAGYLQMSSIMAFGMPSGEDQLSFYRVPRAVYGKLKRWAEGKALALGAERGIDVFPCRLGQVHGVLQSVTVEYRSRVLGGELCLAGTPDSLSNTVFTNGVASAAMAYARGEVEPRRVHTLVSNPQWTLAELGEAYRSLHAAGSRDLELIYRPPERRRPPGLAVVRGASVMTPIRDFVETNVFLRMPELFGRAKGAFRARSVRAEAARSEGPCSAPISGLLGAVPGPLVPGIDSSLGGTLVAQRELAARFDALLDAARR